MLTTEKENRLDYSGARSRDKPHVVALIASQFSLVDGILHRQKPSNDRALPVKGFKCGHYLHVKIASEAVALHSIIVMLSTGALIPDGMTCDHIDGNKLNNHASNLRVVTIQENAQNRAIGRNSTTKRVNVTKTVNGTYTAAYRVSGQNIYVGTFPTIESAVAARNESLAIHAPEKLASIQRRRLEQ